MCHLLTAHQQEPFLPFSSWQSLTCCLSRVAKRSTPKPRGPLPFPSEPRGPFPHFRTSWYSLLLLQNHMDLYLSTCSRTSWFPHLLQNCVVSSFSPKTLWSSLLLWSRVVSSSPSEPHGLLLIYFGAAWSLLTLWLLGLGFNPSAHLPLQPHFRLLLQSATPASIPYSSSFSELP